MGIKPCFGLVKHFKSIHSEFEKAQTIQKLEKKTNTKYKQLTHLLSFKTQAWSFNSPF